MLLEIGELVFFLPPSLLTATINIPNAPYDLVIQQMQPLFLSER